MPNPPDCQRVRIASERIINASPTRNSGIPLSQKDETTSPAPKAHTRPTVHLLEHIPLTSRCGAVFLFITVYAEKGKMLLFMDRFIMRKIKFYFNLFLIFPAFCFNFPVVSYNHGKGNSDPKECRGEMPRDKPKGRCESASV